MSAKNFARISLSGLFGPSKSPPSRCRRRGIAEGDGRRGLPFGEGGDRGGLLLLGARLLNGHISALCRVLISLPNAIGGTQTGAKTNGHENFNF